MSGPHWDFTRSITGIRLMAEWGLERGVDVARILSRAGIPEAGLNDPAAEVTGQQELQLISDLVGELPDEEGLGFDCGQRYHITAFGTLGFALISSRSVREALDIAMGYLGLTNAFVRFVGTDDGERAIIDVFDDELRELVADPVRRFIVERDVSASLVLFRDIHAIQPFLADLWLAFPAPERPERYELQAGLRPRFDAPCHRIALRAEVLDQPLPQANELALSAARQQCDALLNQRRARRGLSARIRQRLADEATEMPSLDRVARELHTTSRTLRRHLKAEGTTFIELREEVRQVLAREYLTGSRLSIERIAERLGYRESTSFINAYKRWYGRTPHASRRKG